MPTELDNIRTGLLEDLASAVECLERCGEEQWAVWLARDAERIRDGHVEGLDHLIRAFGGMGSINDLWLSPINGHSIREEDAQQANEVLHALLMRIRRSAKLLLDDLSNR